MSLSPERAEGVRVALMQHGAHRNASTSPKASAPVETPPAPDRLLALRVAGLAGIDPRTAARALRFGVKCIKGAHVQRRILDAFRELGIAQPESRAA